MGGWRPVQSRSYFAIKLPHGWWLIGTDVQQKLFGTMPAIGMTVRIAGQPYDVIGVLADKVQLSSYFSPDKQSIFIPYTTMDQLTDTQHVRVFVFQAVTPLLEAKATTEVRQLLAQRLGRANDLREIRRAVERHPHGAALPGQGREDGLADPPDGVGDELHALVRIELPGSREQPHVALPDQIGQGQAAVLVLLGHRDHEPQVALGQLLHGLLVAGADLTGERNLLRRGQQGRLAHLVEVLVQ